MQDQCNVGAGDLEDERFWSVIQRQREAILNEHRGKGNILLEELAALDKHIEAALLQYLRPSQQVRLKMDRFEANLSAKVRFHASLAQLIREWTSFVMAVEQGYQLEIEDYDNDLDTRQVLEDFMDEVPEARPKLELLLKPWDERFIRATEKVEHPIWGTATMRKGRLTRLPDSQVNWWYFRLPRDWGGARGT